MVDDALFGPDGTQALAPPAVMADPLSGLVTGAAPLGEAAATGAPIEVPGVPAVPGIAAIRQAVDAALTEDRPIRRAVRGPVTARHVAPPPAPAMPRMTIPRPPVRVPARPPRSNTNGLVTLLVLIVIVVLFFLLRGLASTLSGVFH